jgi:hypothetical protein
LTEQVKNAPLLFIETAGGILGSFQEMTRNWQEFVNGNEKFTAQNQPIG